MGNGVIGALNDYLDQVVQVTVRSEAGKTFDSVKIELHGKLGLANEGYSVAAPDGTVIGRLVVDDSAAELDQWRDPDDTSLARTGSDSLSGDSLSRSAPSKAQRIANVPLPHLWSR